MSVTLPNPMPQHDLDPNLKPERRHHLIIDWFQVRLRTVTSCLSPVLSRIDIV